MLAQRIFLLRIIIFAHLTKIRQSFVRPAQDGGGSSTAGAAATAAKPKAKRAKDPAKGVLRLPTPATLRKEARANDDAIANTDPKAAKKFGKEQVKLVSWHVHVAPRILLSSPLSMCFTGRYCHPQNGVLLAFIAGSHPFALRGNRVVVTVTGAFPQMHRMVDADWHDGEEEQTEALYGYFKASSYRRTMRPLCVCVPHNVPN